MATIIDIDPAEAFVGTNDIVRFSNGKFDWRVDKSLPMSDTVYVTSLVGGRKAVGRLSNVITAKRDLTFVPEEDHTWEYTEGWQDNNE